MSELRDAVELARRPEVVAAVHEIYADLERAIAERRPRCDASGRCCHFEGYGHRLYSTTVELAAFVEDLQGVPPAPPTAAADKSLPILGACPLLVNSLCSVHEVRPFGCRIFFCDPTADEWMREQYELHLWRLKAVHEQFGIPYHYVEWRAALLALGVVR